MVLANSKHERFAQAIVEGAKLGDAYTSAGYSKTSARSNALRLSTNEGISARINELKTAIAVGVVAAEIRQRSWRVQQLQGLADDMLNRNSQLSPVFRQMGEYGLDPRQALDRKMLEL